MVKTGLVRLDHVIRNRISKVRDRINHKVKRLQQLNRAIKINSLGKKVARTLSSGWLFKWKVGIDPGPLANRIGSDRTRRF